MQLASGGDKPKQPLGMGRPGTSGGPANPVVAAFNIYLLRSPTTAQRAEYSSSIS
jgi:hypothetical protein